MSSPVGEPPVTDGGGNYKDAKANAKASAAYAKAQRPWYKKKRFWLLGLIALIIIGTALGNSGGSKKSSPSNPTSSAASAPKSSGGSTSSAAAAPSSAADPKDSLTGQQKQAYESAKNYLSFQGFSRAGLIDQLSSQAGDKYPVADATAAVNALKVNWNEQAAKAAKNYLDSGQSFSCSGLIEQLSSDSGSKFTAAQATYGAHQTSACK